MKRTSILIAALAAVGAATVAKMASTPTLAQSNFEPKLAKRQVQRGGQNRQNGRNEQIGDQNGPNEQIGDQNGPNEQVGDQNGPNEQVGDQNGPDEQGDRQGGDDEMITAPVNMGQAVNAATRRVQGYANSAQLENANGVPIWNVDIVQPDGRSKQEVQINGRTGAIVRVSVDQGENDGEQTGEHEDTSDDGGANP